MVTVVISYKSNVYICRNFNDSYYKREKEEKDFQFWSAKELEGEARSPRTTVLEVDYKMVLQKRQYGCFFLHGLLWMAWMVC